MSIAAETAESTAQANREDRFRFDVCCFDLNFPCAVCIHREKEPSECCSECRYFFN